MKNNVKYLFAGMAALLLLRKRNNASVGAIKSYDNIRQQGMRLQDEIYALGEKYGDPERAERAARIVREIMTKNRYNMEEYFNGQRGRHPHYPLYEDYETPVSSDVYDKPVTVPKWYN